MSMLTTAQVFGSGASGVFRITGALAPARLGMQAGLHGLRLAGADCSRVRTRRGLLRVVARALHFPAYFGLNWDAFEECLTDLEWLDQGGVVLALGRADRLAARAPRDFAMAIEVLQGAADYWAGEDRPFVALVQARARTSLPLLPAVRIG
jgi:hypothetical protein